MDFRKWVAVFGTMLGAFMAVLDIQITNSSLRDISGGIAATPDEGSWISTAYLVGEIVTIALTAWLAQVFTVRYYLVVNVLLFLTFSALCGISNSLGQMIVFRAGQGFTGGVFIPMALTVIVSTMPKNLLPVGQAMFGMTATLAPAIGPALGGWLTDHFGWEWNFYVNVIPGALMLIAILYGVRKESMKLEQLRGGDCGEFFVWRSGSVHLWRCWKKASERTGSVAPSSGTARFWQRFLFRFLSSSNLLEKDPS